MIEVKLNSHRAGKAAANQAVRTEPTGGRHPLSKEETGMVRRIWMVLSVALLAVMTSPMMAMAQGTPADQGAGLRGGLLALGAGIGLGIAAMGCGLGQGRIGASAMESIGRNPNSTNQLFVPMIIGLAFVESLTLYALVIAFILQGKI
jgi:F-type H+-transporting ATPase subunit c